MKCWWLAMVMGVVWAGGCATGPTRETSPGDVPVLRIGVAPNYPPLASKVQGELEGFEIDMARRVAQRMARTPQFVILKFDALLPALAEGKIDVAASGLSVTAGRAAQARFTDSLLPVGQMILVRGSEARQYADVRLLSVMGSRIGVEASSTGDLYVQRVCVNARRQPYSSIQKAVAALKRGQVDVVLHDAPAILHQAAIEEAEGLVPVPGVLTRENLAWAVRRDNEALLNELNADIASLRQDGTLQKLIEQWMPLYAAYWSNQPEGLRE